MTLTITATGQPAEIEEVTEGGFYCLVAGHSRFLPLDAVTHPAPAAPTCPHCGSNLARSYDRLGVYMECQRAFCFYTASAPALFDSRV